MEENTIEKNEENDEQKNIRRARPATEKSGSDSAAFRVLVPEAVTVRVRGVIAELKSRGIEVRAEEVMREYLSDVPEHYFEEQLMRLTPEDYYLVAASQIPGLREKLIRQAKRALVNIRKVQSGAPTRKYRKKAADEPKTAGAET